MLKYLIYITVGYLIFKIVKNGVYVAIDNLQKPKELKGTTELMRCSQCGGFFNAEQMIKHDGKSFCSDDCKQGFQKNPQ